MFTWRQTICYLSKVIRLKSILIWIIFIERWLFILLILVELITIAIWTFFCSYFYAFLLNDNISGIVSKLKLKTVHDHMIQNPLNKKTILFVCIFLLESLINVCLHRQTIKHTICRLKNYDESVIWASLKRFVSWSS